MIRHPAVVDTNVVIAGLLTKSADSPTASMVNGMLSASFPFVLSETLLAEYAAVLFRPAIRKLHLLSEVELESILLEIARHAIVLDPSMGPKSPDRGDQLLWDLLGARPDLVLVTGDKLLLRSVEFQGRVVTPREFLAGE